MKPNPREFIRAVEERDKHREAVNASLVKMGEDLVENYEKYADYFDGETDKIILNDLYEALIKFAGSLLKQQKEIGELRQEVENKLLEVRDKKGQVEGILKEINGRRKRP